MEKECYAPGPSSHMVVASARAWTRRHPSDHLCLVVSKMRLPARALLRCRVRVVHEVSPVVATCEQVKLLWTEQAVPGSPIPCPSAQPGGPHRPPSHGFHRPCGSAASRTHTSYFPNTWQQQMWDGKREGELGTLHSCGEKKSIEWFFSLRKKGISKWNDEFPDSHLQDMGPVPFSAHDFHRLVNLLCRVWRWKNPPPLSLVELPWPSVSPSMGFSMGERG